MVPGEQLEGERLDLDDHAAFEFTRPRVAGVLRMEDHPGHADPTGNGQGAGLRVMLKASAHGTSRMPATSTRHVLAGVPGLGGLLPVPPLSTTPLVMLGRSSQGVTLSCLPTVDVNYTWLTATITSTVMCSCPWHSPTAPSLTPSTQLDFAHCAQAQTRS